MVGAWFILGERPVPHFGWFLVAGLVGPWLIAFPNPFDIHVEAALPALYAITAAVLWAFGTVLGRLLATRLRFQHVTALRFFFGLPASAVAVLIVGAPFFASAGDTFWIAALAVVTGLVALSLYYYGLQRTPAVIAALAELTFPVTAAAVGYFAFDATLDGSQWLGRRRDDARGPAAPDHRRRASSACAARSSCRRPASAPPYGFAVMTFPRAFHWFGDQR